MSTMRPILEAMIELLPAKEVNYSKMKPKMQIQSPMATAPLSVKDRAGQLRSKLTNTSVGSELFAELMPSDIVRVGEGTILDFSDWSQWDKWAQWE